MGESNAPERIKVVVGESGRPVAIHRGLPLLHGCTLGDVVDAAAYDRVVAERDEAQAEREQFRRSLAWCQREALDLAEGVTDALNRRPPALAEGEQPAGEAPGWPDGMYETAAMALYRAVNATTEPPAWSTLNDHAREPYRRHAAAVTDGLTEHLRALIRTEPAAGEQSTTETGGEVVVRFPLEEADILFSHLNDSGCGRRDGYADADVAICDRGHETLGAALRAQTETCPECSGRCAVEVDDNEDEPCYHCDQIGAVLRSPNTTETATGLTEDQRREIAEETYSDLYVWMTSGSYRVAPAVLRAIDKVIGPAAAPATPEGPDA